MNIDDKIPKFDVMRRAMEMQNQLPAGGDVVKSINPEFDHLHSIGSAVREWSRQCLTGSGSARRRRREKEEHPPSKFKVGDLLRCVSGDEECIGMVFRKSGESGLRGGGGNYAFSLIDQWDREPVAQPDWMFELWEPRVGDWVLAEHLYAGRSEIDLKERWWLGKNYTSGADFWIATCKDESKSRIWHRSSEPVCGVMPRPCHKQMPDFYKVVGGSGGVEAFTTGIPVHQGHYKLITQDSSDWNDEAHKLRERIVAEMLDAEVERRR